MKKIMGCPKRGGGPKIPVRNLTLKKNAEMKLKKNVRVETVQKQYRRYFVVFRFYAMKIYSVN